MNKLGLEDVEIASVDLTQEQFNLPLFVHMAALAMLRGRKLKKGDELLNDTIMRERRFWDLNLQAINLDHVRFAPLVGQALALITMVGGCRDMSRLRFLVSSVPLAERLATLDVTAITSLIASLYPVPNELGALKPDILGEQLVALELEKEPGLYDAILR